MEEYQKNLSIKTAEVLKMARERLYALKRKTLWILAGIAGLMVLAVGGVLFYLYFFGAWSVPENPTFAAIKKGELVATGKVGDRVRMGDLEITFRDVIEGTYHPLELDENFKRVPPKSYLGLGIMIFHTGYGEKEFLLFGLTDDLGNQYERDPEIDFYVDGVSDFGPAREIYPRTIRGNTTGDERYYLLFPAPAPEAKKLTLTILSETTNKKVELEIER